MSGRGEEEVWREAKPAEREAVAAVLILVAERGSAEASRALAGFAAQLLQAGLELPDSLRAWLCGNLERIEAGKAPPFAPTARSVHGLKGMELRREIAIADDFAALREFGFTADEAAAAVGEVIGASPRKVTEVWSRRRHEYPEGEDGAADAATLRVCVSADGTRRVSLAEDGKVLLSIPEAEYEAAHAQTIELAAAREVKAPVLARYAHIILREGRKLPQALRDWLDQKER